MQSKRLDSIYQSSQRFKRSPVSQVFRAGYIEWTKLKSQEDANKTMSAALGGLENVERALRRAITEEVTQTQIAQAIYEDVLPKGLEYYLGLIETMDDLGELDAIEEEDEEDDEPKRKKKK